MDKAFSPIGIDFAGERGEHHEELSVIIGSILVAS